MTTNDKKFQPRFFRKVEEPYRINELITAPTIRVTGENIEPGIYQLQQGLDLAKSMNLDLVEISRQASPPVCKIIDYSKFRYEQKKKQREIKAKTQKNILKEMRLGPNTDEHDFNFKIKYIISFLQDGFKVKPYVQFTGRSINFKERGRLLLLKIAQATEEYGKIEYMPKMEGRKMFMTIISKNTKSGS